MPAQTTAPRGVLFDFDGVLIDSLPVMRQALRAAWEEVHGRRCDDFETLFARYREHLGKGFPEIMRALGLPLAMHPPFVAHSRRLAGGVLPCPGAAELLQALRAGGWRLGLATGKDEARTRELLALLGWSAYFEVVLGSDSVGAPKPAPEMAEVFMARTGVPQARLVMVGDAPADLECAQAAGCLSVAALWGYTPAETLRSHAPAFEAESPAALLAWLQALPMAKP